MNTYFWALIGGVILWTSLSMIPFIDFLSILIKIFPANAPSDIKAHENLVNSGSYKRHKSKWKKIFILVPVVYAASYCVIAVLFKSSLSAFYAACIVSGLYFGIASNIEYKQRKLLISKSQK